MQMRQIDCGICVKRSIMAQHFCLPAARGEEQTLAAGEYIFHSL